MTDDIRNRIDQYGLQIDHLSIGYEYEKLRILIDEMVNFASTDDEIKNDAGLNYYLGTGIGTYSDYLVRSGKPHTDATVIELRRKSMFYLRKGIILYDPAIHHDPSAKLRILTNYANGLDTVGRVLEALRIFRRVLDINEHFSMALGNYGRSLQFLANMVNDVGHYKELHCYAYQAIKKALTIDDPDLHEQATAGFQKIVDEYESLPTKDVVAEPIAFQECTLGENEEYMYREWCLRNHLFLNPLNEVIEMESAFAHDPLTITTYTEDIRSSDSVSENPAEPPRWFAMLNQLKEEYAYARFLCYEGSEKYGEVHFADKAVSLSLASYDHIQYSFRIEQLKSSFHILYSMLDQICFFANDFWDLGFEEKKADTKRVYNSLKNHTRNRALMALYWVLCEFSEKFGEAEEPSEKSLSVLRNAFEHKYVKVHKNEWNRDIKKERDSFYHISEEELKKLILRLLELSREALMYLVYAVGIEESQKEIQGISVPMHLGNYPDEWKL